MHKITDGIKILINTEAEAMIPDSFQCFQLHLETFFVLEQRYLLTRGYTITYKTNRRYKIYETDLYICYNALVSKIKYSRVRLILLPIVRIFKKSRNVC